MNRHISSRRGFVTFIAMTMLVVVSAAMLLIGQTFTLDARRSLGRQLDAQLDQLLLAGTVDASARLLAAGAAPVNPWKVELPDSISAISSLEITPIASDVEGEARMTIRASFGDRKASQDLTFRRIEGVWKLTAAEINEHMTPAAAK